MVTKPNKRDAKGHYLGDPENFMPDKLRALISVVAKEGKNPSFYVEMLRGYVPLEAPSAGSVVEWVGPAIIDLSDGGLLFLS